jgi:hypothetical protein
VTNNSCQIKEVPGIIIIISVAIIIIIIIILINITMGIRRAAVG